MVTYSGQQNIRGIDIDKLAKGFAEEDIVLKKFVTNTSTGARELRWYQKTAGFITATSPNQINNNAQGALPSILEQSWTRQTSYVKKFIVESPLLSDEDIKDTDIDVLATNIHDLTRAIAHAVDKRIYDVIGEISHTGEGTGTYSQVYTNTNAVAAAWNTASFTSVDMIADIMQAKAAIRAYAYDPEGCIAVMTPQQHKYLVDWLITQKGSSIPIFASSKVQDGVVMEFLGVRIVVNLVAVSGSIVMFTPQRSATWKSFVPITAAQVPDVGIGTKIRIWEEGECLLTDPKSVSVITGVGI
jgi:hypothetical protein